MEYALPELMTRQEILQILSARELKMPDIELLPYNELLRIYKTFAVPLARRELKHSSNKKIGTTFGQAPKAMEVDATGQMGSGNVPQEISLQVECKMSSLPLCLKRPCPAETQLAEDYQQLNAATKRIKICWP